MIKFKRPELLEATLRERVPCPSGGAHEWNVPIPPDLMYHIIDNYLITFTILALCIAFPVLRPYCYPQPYRHISVDIRDGVPSPQGIFVRIQLSRSNSEKSKSISISTLDNVGYTDGGRARGVMSLVTDLTQDLTSIHLDVQIKWCQLDEYTKAYMIALLQRSGLCSVSLKNFDIPVNLLGVVPNLKLLDVRRSPGPPDNQVSSTARVKVHVEEVHFHNSIQSLLIGPGSPVDWSRLSVMVYYGYWGGPLIIQSVLELCTASLQRLDIVIRGGDKGFINLSVLTGLRHLTLSIRLTYSSEQPLYNSGTYSSLEPFKWVPYILESCYGHNGIERIVLKFGTINPEHLRQCGWLSVDKIFEREGTWTALREVLVVNHRADERCSADVLQSDDLEWMQPSRTPCLQGREVINWRRYIGGST